MGRGRSRVRLHAQLSGRKALEAEHQAAAAEGDSNRAIAFERAIRFGDRSEKSPKPPAPPSTKPRWADQNRAPTPTAAERRYNQNVALGRYRYENSHLYRWVAAGADQDELDERYGDRLARLVRLGLLKPPPEEV